MNIRIQNDDIVGQLEESSRAAREAFDRFRIESNLSMAQDMDDLTALLRARRLGRHLPVKPPPPVIVEIKPL